MQNVLVGWVKGSTQVLLCIVCSFYIQCHTFSLSSIAPCSPSITTTSLDCGSSSAAIHWSGVANAVDYLVNATSTDGHMASCGSANASCALSQLQCGQTYTVVVTAQGEQCSSNPSATTNVITGASTRGHCHQILQH